MRIIKNPNPVEEIEKTCPECECEFSYTDGDVKTYSYSNGVLGPGNYGYFKKYVLCPNCGKEIIIKEKSSDYHDYYKAMGMGSSFIEKKLIDGLGTGPEGEETIQVGQDIEELTMFPHLENHGE